MKIISHRNIYISFALICLVLTVASAWAQAVRYPNYTSTYVNDFANLLDPRTEERISQKLVELRDEKGIEFTVVTINQMRDYGHMGEIEPFATGLFNFWGVGDKDRNDGVMMLVAIKDRQMRIEVGSGYGSSMDRPMQEIIDADILPYFKEGDYQQGIKDGVDEVLYRLRNPDAGKAIGNRLADKYLFFLPEWMKIMVAIIVVFGGFIVSVGVVLVGGIYYPIKGIIYLVKKSIELSQNTPPKCEKCASATKKARKEERMAALTAGQIAELECDSVIYKTWRCTSCAHVTIKRFKRWFTKFKPCPQCEYVTLKITKTVLKPATETKTGHGEKIYDCMNCDYKNMTPYVISKVSKNRRSGGSSGGSSSFGGGRSSGGGASGRW